MILLSFVARSLDLIDAFIDACDRWNLSVASGLVRLQVDNVIRVHLVSTSPDPPGLLNHMLSGEPLRKYMLPDEQRRRLPAEYRRSARATDATSAT